MHLLGIFVATALALAGWSSAQEGTDVPCASLDQRCSDDVPCCNPVHDCEEGICSIRIFYPAHGQACGEDCSCALTSEECIDGVCQPVGECAEGEDDDCNNDIPCCDPAYDCIEMDYSYGFGYGVCGVATANTGGTCTTDDSCRFEYDVCVGGVCKVNPDVQEDVSARTGVTATANAFDARVAEIDGCGSEGCVPELTRDGSRDAASRWSCSNTLGRGECQIEYTFDEPQDVLSMNVAFYQGDSRARTVEVFGDGRSLGEFTSSGNTLDFENWTLNAKDVSVIAIMPKYLGEGWLSITEVELLSYRQSC